RRPGKQRQPEPSHVGAAVAVERYSEVQTGQGAADGAKGQGPDPVVGPDTRLVSHFGVRWIAAPPSSGEAAQH
nr:hypothetical protein [Tanacetum cinerariifolium]